MPTGGATGVKDALGGGKVAKRGNAAAGGDAADADEPEEETFYDAMKKEMGDRAARTRAALDALDPGQRVAMEGHRRGAYLRLRFTGDALPALMHPGPICVLFSLR
jgi:ribosome biogenesis protein BMS1